MAIDMNNVFVTHKDKTVSIAQHTRDLSMPNLHGGTTTMREIAICSPNKETGENMSIWFYGQSLDSLINRLVEVRDEIDKQN